MSHDLTMIHSNVSKKGDFKGNLSLLRNNYLETFLFLLNVSYKQKKYLFISICYDLLREIII